MKTFYLLILIAGTTNTLYAQKVTVEPGMGLGFGILTSGGTPTEDGNGSMGLALQLGLRYHFDPQFSMGLHLLAQDQLIGGKIDTPEQVTFLPENNSTRLMSLNGRYEFNKKEKEKFFFVGLGLALNRNRRYIRVNDVEKIGKTSISLIPEAGLQVKGFQILLSFTTPASSPSFDQVGNDDDIRYVMEKGRVATLQYSLRYQLRLFKKD